MNGQVIGRPTAHLAPDERAMGPIANVDKFAPSRMAAPSSVIELITAAARVNVAA